MRRWNGWGEQATTYPLLEPAANYLAQSVGVGCTIPDAGYEQVLSSICPSPLPPHHLITTGSTDRLLHARGQSLPDWIALRHNRLGVFPAGVSYPARDEDVRQLFDYAQKTGVKIIPYGGGTSVVGHINPLPEEAPVVTVDLSRMNRLLDLDETSRLATFEAGVCGPEIENQLNSRGYTLGHFPQSFELSTLGGWIATRSSGQQSYHYGRIEDLFAGGHVETPEGPLQLLNLPASAAGPDIRQLILGSEGRLGILTRATVRIRPLPETESFYGLFFPDWQSGAEAVRTIAQARIPVSMARLSDALETETTLVLSGKDRLVAWANRGLNLVGYGADRCLLILGVTGDRKPAGAAYRAALAVCRANGGLPTGSLIGKMWRKSRFLTPYLRDTLWERGYALDTLETARPWSGLLEVAAEVKQAIRAALQAEGERVLVFAHLSHIYRDGASLYVTFLFRRSDDPDLTLDRWRRMKAAASQVILASGGTISHQHGVGLDHAPYLAAEKGQVGIKMLEALRQSVDPHGILNPGKLLALKE